MLHWKNLVVFLACRHKYGWPQKGKQTCLRCGNERESLVQIVVNPRLNAERYRPKVKAT